MQKFRTLQLGKFFPIKGGVEQVEYSLLTGLSERGYTCDMLCAATEGKGEIRDINALARLITTRSWAKLKATMISPSMVYKLWSTCNKHYDIVHVHHPDPMAALALFLSGFKGKVVLHWHSDIVKQKQLLKLYKPLQDWLIRRADVIVGTSPKYIAESPFLSQVQDKTVCVPIGVPAVKTDPIKVEQLRQQYPGKKIIFTLGRLVEYKGFEYLIKAARYLASDYEILIGGSGPLKEALQQKIDRLQLNEKVKLLGRIADEDLPAYYGACHLFALPSVFKSEAFGLVQIEAMSCGKPVVATNIPESGVSWVNKHGYSGLNVTPGNVQELATAITAITTDDIIYNRYCTQAKAHYDSLFTLDLMIENCISVYEHVMMGSYDKAYIYQIKPASPKVAVKTSTL